MNDDALIRLENLKALGLAPKVLSEQVGGRVSYWADMLRGKKSFGEKAARNIEEKLGMPRGCMDMSEGLPARPMPVAAPAPSQDDLLLALTVVAQAVSKADEMTRLSVEPLLSLLAREPSQSGNIAQRLHKLLQADSRLPQTRDDVATGLRTIGLPTPRSMGTKDGRSDSTQKQSGTR